MTLTVTGYHDFSAAHRAVGDKGKCGRVHGHNYRLHVEIDGNQYDDLGRLIDFDVLKSRIFQWIELNWDHRFLVWKRDPIVGDLKDMKEDDRGFSFLSELMLSSVVITPFNPSTEMMAEWVVEMLGPVMLKDYPTCRLMCVRIEETRKFGAKAVRDTPPFLTPIRRVDLETEGGMLYL